MSIDPGQIDKKNIPSHVAVIMDGNGRWAKERSLPRSEGHRAGSLVIEKLMDAAMDLNLNYISLYAFSTENWNRPPTEIQGLWKLLSSFFNEKLPIMKEKGIRVVHSGRRKALPSNVLNAIDSAVSETKNNKKITLNFCLNYGGRQEIIDAVNEWNNNKKSKESLSEKTLRNYLYSPDIPDVDLMIRTSGEYRISNFLLWESAYSELVFQNVLWPDYSAENLYEAIIEYQNRSRRFGGL